MAHGSGTGPREDRSRNTVCKTHDVQSVGDREARYRRQYSTHQLSHDRVLTTACRPDELELESEVKAGSGLCWEITRLWDGRVGV